MITLKKVLDFTYLEVMTNNLNYLNFHLELLDRRYTFNETLPPYLEKLLMFYNLENHLVIKECILKNKKYISSRIRLDSIEKEIELFQKHKRVLLQVMSIYPEELLDVALCPMEIG